MADIINVTPEEPQQDTNHEQQMIDKAEGKAPAEETTPLLAGKYKTEEDLQKGTLELLKRGGKNLEEVYKELESGLGKPKEESKTPEEVKPPEAVINQGDEETEFDFTPFEQEMLDKGELTQESYDALKKAGYSKKIVDQYLEGTKALAERETKQIYDITGGQDNYQAVIDWASKTLSKQEQEDFNAAINNGLGVAKFAVEALYNRYTKNNTQAPTGLLNGVNNASANTDRYESRAQMTADMNNPLYNTDSAFRKKVQEKLGRSDIL